MHHIFIFLRVHQPETLLGGLLAAAGSVVGYVLHALPRSKSEFRQHLPAALPIHVSAKSREDVHPENKGGGAAETLNRTGVGHGECTQLRIRRLSRKCRKCYGSKYADL